MARILDLQRMRTEERSKPAVSTSSINCGGYDQPFESSCSIYCI